MEKTIRLRVSLVVGLLITLANVFAVKSASAATLAAPVKLAWDASPDSSVTGYALYYRLADSFVSSRLDLGPARSATLHNLEAGSSYTFFVVAYDAAGVESPSSNTLLYEPPAISRLQISKQTDGSMKIQFRAAAGTLCSVEHSPTLVSPQWQTLDSATADVNGEVVINDPLPKGHDPVRPSMRFYRGVLQ